MSIIEVAETCIPRPQGRVVKMRALTLDAAICADMTEQYRLLCIKRRFVKRQTAAFTICAQAFPDLDLKIHPNTVRMVEIRQQLMVFCRVILAGIEPQANSWQAIARMFNCRHGTVINAYRIFGEAMERAIHG